MLPIALLALALVQEPLLLPDAPDGWRLERATLPMPFSPDMEVEGFAELRFSPGMFRANSDSHFSYAIALRIENDVRVDEAFLEDFVIDYYTGLCRAVGGSRNLDLDLDAIDAHVELGAHGFEAEVDSFDPFATAGPIQLSIEFSVQAHLKDGKQVGTDVLGLVSPKPKTAGIWSDLRDFGERWRAKRPAQSFLNHLYLVPDAETYAAIAKSDFLNQGFGIHEERTTVRPDITYTGNYFYGRHTYFEFLNPESGLLQPGSTGIAFGCETPGSIQTLSASLKDEGIQTFPNPIQRQLDDQQVPWYQGLGIEQATTETKLSLFTMEYHEAFLKQWHPELAEASNDKGAITRSAILQRYAANLGELRHEEVLLQDVIELFIELSPADCKRLLDTCQTFGYRIDTDKEETVCTGPGYRLRVRQVENSKMGGITGFVVKLAEPQSKREIELGKLKIELRGRRAIFRM